MSEFPDQLGALVETLQLHSPHSFTLRGRRYESEDSEAGLEAGSVLTSEARALLAEILYVTLHCRRPVESPPADWAAAREFAYRLSAANTGSGTWQSGWVVRELGRNDRIVAEKHGVRFWVPSADFRPSNGAPEVGGQGSVKVPAECWNLLPGFYLALGDSGDLGPAVRGIVRVYWHLWAEGAAPLVGLLTRELNGSGVPFELKLLADGALYPRTDAAVLYLAATTYREMASLLSRIHLELLPWLREPVSAFVKRIAPGVGLAEDQADGSSFGEHRSGLLAAELTRAEIPPGASARERCDAVLRGLRGAGWDPEALYLNPGSLDDYPVLGSGYRGAI